MFNVLKICLGNIYFKNLNNAMVLLTLLKIWLMCGFQLISLSTIIPKNLHSDFCSRPVLLALMVKVVFSFLFVNNIQYYNQFICSKPGQYFFKLSINFSSKFSNGEPLVVNVVSSASWLKSNNGEELHMSFIYNRKSKGPSVEPWGTPILTIPNSEFK